MTNILNRALTLETQTLAKILSQNNLKIVFAESCTGGMISTFFTQIPGISESFCGSAVVYRLDTKTKWLGVKAITLKAYSAVSRQVTEEMVQGVLAETPEADIAASVTGYLGPDAPSGQLGHVFISVVSRGSKQLTSKEFWFLTGNKTKKLRLKRQVLASQAVIAMVRSLLSKKAKSNIRKLERERNKWK